MRFSLFRAGVALLVGASLFQPAVLHGQPKTAEARLDERLFLLYALETMPYRMDPREASRRGSAELPTQVAARFVAQRRVLLDLLRQHMERKKDKDKYDELLTAFRGYKKELDLLDDWRKQLDESCSKITTRLAVVANAAASQAMLTGLNYGLRGLAEGDDDNGFGRGMAALLVSFSAQQPRINAARIQAIQELNTVCNTAIKELEPRLAEERKQFQELFARTAKALAESNRWEETDFVFDWKLRKDKQVVGRNPFLVVEQAAAILRNKDASVAELMEQAQVCVRAAESVPADRAYNYYRAAFLGVAGRIANHAALQDYGATGMPTTPKAILKSGKLARTIWIEYARHEPFDTNVNDEVIQAYILAQTFGGDPKTAAGLIQLNILQPMRFGGPVVKPTVSARPDFWYDCARISSLVGNVLLAQQCLEQATKLGFREGEAAKVSPDLRNVRESNATAQRFKRTFP